MSKCDWWESDKPRVVCKNPATFKIFDQQMGMIFIGRACDKHRKMLRDFVSIPIKCKPRTDK